MTIVVPSEIYKGYRIEVDYEPSKNYCFRIYRSIRDNPDCYSGWNTMEIAFSVARECVDWWTSQDYCDLDYQDPKEYPDFLG
ncbi:hypothetical protein NIES4103_27630 [Nostoc sp. NIES-4103]|nr:hypothetical protein NIES4103_27630 [Nostoc sp. NIES-4103]